MEEIWKDIEGEEGFQVSNLGRVRHITVAMLKPSIRPCRSNSVYAQSRVSINRHHYAVHRLVAQAFIDKPKGKEYVNHKDGNPQNNVVSNLEWVTAKENTHHALVNGLKKMKIPFSKYGYVCEEYSKGRTMQNIADEFGVHATRIRDILIQKGITIRKKGNRSGKYNNVECVRTHARIH